MHARGKAIAALISTIAIGLIPVSAEAATSCKTINKTYQYGIAVSKFSKNIGLPIVGKPAVSSKLYKKHIKLDIDKDGIVCEVAKPTPAPTPKPTVPAGFLGNINGSVDESYKSNIKYSSTMHPEFLKIIDKSIRDAIDATDEIAKPKKFSIFLFTIKDADWLQGVLNETGAYRYMPASSAQQYLSNSYSDDCGQGFVAKDSENNPMFFQCTAYDGSGWNSAPHEYFHMVQTELGQFSSNNVPIWMLEGLPTYFQDLLNNNLSPYNRGLAKFSKGQLLSKLYRLETTMDPNGSIVQAENGYQIGYFATKYLTDNYGYDKIVSFNKEVSKTSWKPLFEKTFGLTSDEFYVKVVEEIIKYFPH
jgi:Excalibur calcium-binding domain